MLFSGGVCGRAVNSLTWDQALLLFFFASLLLWLESEKNNAWYIYLTSHQPPPNLHNLTSAWPVMLLANQRLPEGIKFWRENASFEINFREKKCVSTVRSRFLRKILNVFFFVMKYCWLELHAVPLFNSYK